MATLTMGVFEKMPRQLGGAPECKTCGTRVYFNEQKLFMSRAWHTKCFRCGDCNKLLDTGNANLMEDESVVCNQCKRKIMSPTVEKSPPVEAYINPEDPDCCPRCGKRVYFAEQTSALGRKWHHSCFCCANCNKHLEPVNATDHKAEVYCKSCYGRLFGPKGYGYAGGAGTGLSSGPGDTSEAPKMDLSFLAGDIEKLGVEDGPEGMSRSPSGGESKWGGQGEKCPRCAKTVYMAEKRAAAGNSYHEWCFTCLECKKRLEQGKLTEKEGEIYCNVCYSKNFGPKGYGFGGGAGTLNSP